MTPDVYSANIICESIKQITRKDQKPTSDTIYQYLQENHGECDTVFLKAEIETLGSRNIIAICPRANDKSGESY